MEDRVCPMIAIYFKWPCGGNELPTVDECLNKYDDREGIVLA